MTSYLRNAWYPAAWNYELESGPVSRVILETPTLLFRDGEGKLAAMQDRCPHRFAPLSRGTISDGIVRCGYHGLRFDSSGRCVHSPYSQSPPTHVSVRTFAVAEAHTMCWIWPGDPSRADPALIPDVAFMTDTVKFRTLRGVSSLAAEYQLGTDNLMDLSHIEFIHGGTFGGQGVIHQGTHKSFERDGAIHSNWWIPDIENPASQEANFPMNGRNVDHWLDMRWHAPASMQLDIGVTPTGEDRSVGGHIMGAHLLTPAGPHQTHYFWSMSRPYAMDSIEADIGIRAYLVKAFDDEDKPMIEAVGRSLGGEGFWESKPLVLPIDTGAIRVRRCLAAMISAEAENEARPNVAEAGGA